MEFDLSDEQREIKSTARDFLASRFKPERVRELAESDSPYDDDVWREICELGWPGLAIAEEYGGQGLGTVELAIVQEQLGYACAPSPMISNAYAGALIEAAGSDEQRSRWLPGIASGEAIPHRLADMLWEVEEARSLTLYAAWAADAQPETLALAASMAKARASDSAWSVSHNAIQTLGGIGFTWEHDVHFLLKRARVSAELLGSAAQHRERVAALTGLAAAEPAVA